jgi:hypothetical protein
MAKKKKIKEKKEKKEIITSYKDYELGEKVWGLYVDGSVVEGTINKFYITCESEPCISILTQDRGCRIIKEKLTRKKKITRAEAAILKNL